MTYPQHWQEWLDTPYIGSFFTNQEILESNDQPAEWFNPFVEPDKILDEIKDFKTAKDVKEHIKELYPGIDTEYYYKLKRQENDEASMAICGQIRSFEFRESDGGATPFSWKCGICATCKEEEARAIEDAWLKVEEENLRIIKVPEKDRAKVTRKLRGQKKQTYLVEKDDGSIECHIVVATDDKDIGEEFDRRNFDYTQWAGSVVGRRQSGNLVENNRNLARGTTKEELEKRVLDEGQVMKAKIIPKFEKLPEGIRDQHDACQAAIDYAMAQTEDYAPESIEEVQQYIKHRERLAIEAIRRMGGVIYRIEYKWGTMHKVTEDTPKKWLDTAQRRRKDKWKNIF